MAETFAKKIEAEIIIPLKKLLKVQKKEEEKIYMKWASDNEEYENKKQTLNKIKSSYLNTFKDISKEINNYEKEYEERADKKELNNRIYKLYEDLKNSEEKYLVAFHNTKEFQTSYKNEIGKTLRSYRELDKDRIKKIKEKLLIFFKHSITLALSAKQIAEDNLIGKINLDKDEAQQSLKELLADSELMIDIPIVQLVNSHEQVFSKLEYMILICKELSYGKLTIPDIKGEESIPSVFRVILTTAWNIGDHNGRIEEFKKHIKHLKGRTQFCDVFNIFRRKGMFIIPTIGYFPVANLLKLVLDEANEANDVNSSLRILLYSQTYYSEMHVKHRLHKIFLQEEIQKHPIWERKDFWEQAIREDIEDENRIRLSTVENEKEMAIKNGIYCKLGALGHNMIQLGIPVNIVNELILGNALKCNLPKDLIEDLKVISSLINREQ